MNANHSGLSEKVEAAFRAVAASVVERAKETRTPVIVWEDGRIKEIPTEQLEPFPALPPGNQSAPSS